MPGPAEGSPLLWPVLASIGTGATAADVESRMAASGVTLSAGTAAAVLNELSRLGLARVTQSGPDGRHFVATSIGQRRLDDGLLGQRSEQERLAELERLRTDLLSTMAHELRTPLTAVRTSIGLLQDEDHAPDAKQRQTLLNTIDRNALRMQRLVGDILDLARFRAGSIQLKLRRFDANELAVVAVTSIAPLAEAAGQTIELVVGEGPVWVFGDYRRLEEALINLISNAQKFSPRGATIGVDVAEADGMIHWTVVDHGPGISEEDQGRLFERFFVGPAERPSGGQGVGLGLPVTLAIVQAHGGTIEVESELGTGSTFRLVVPAEGPEQDVEQ